MVSGGKLNTLKVQRQKCLGVFKSIWKNGNFYAKPIFDKIDFLFCRNSKTNNCKNLKCSSNFKLVLMSCSYCSSHNFFISVLISNFYKICQNRKNLQIIVKKLNTINYKENSIIIGKNVMAYEHLNFKFLRNRITITILNRSLKQKTTFFTINWKIHPRLTNNLRSEPFFVYNYDIYHCIKI
ncbi:hypothetical protein AGLY_000884 [Aphis glycines]|uniref:Uncharacterized protein n=1 Tax=Aphis glycines TaxID=307491 RepID=A0A6G0U885_APHGL|nr:hypothetical protein AGLY_000884 [Aphis glycines]